MTTLFISDLHLDPTHPEMVQVFLNFLQNQATNADALYILGDFFEVWIGDDVRSDFTDSIITALKTVTEKGIPVYIMHGNRDFLLGKKFMQRSGCQLIDDPTLINLYGQPTLLMHGDTLCTDDKPYLQYRSKVRNPARQRIFLSFPLWLRKNLARMLRYFSQRRAKQNNFVFIDANFAEIKRVMLEHKVELLIHGHTHRPSIHYFNLAGKWVERIVLSDWEKQGNVLVCQPDGEQRLLCLLPSPSPAIKFGI